MRLIDPSVAAAELAKIMAYEANMENCAAGYHHTKDDFMDAAESLLENVPTIEAEPGRRGRWREIKSNDWSGGGAYICSVCGYGYSWAGYHEANEFTYCPNCGAKMEDEG